MGQLSEHFSLRELTYSQTAVRYGIPNDPGNAELVNLAALAQNVLEPVRKLLGVPVVIDSGYRSAALNDAVGSTAAHSDHLDGNAADCRFVGMSVDAAFHAIRESDIPYKQLIIECGSWIHISYEPFATTARRQSLIASGGPGNWHYEAVA
jgi:zinc D-Ala-D-Ala carboxypeptidase